MFVSRSDHAQKYKISETSNKPVDFNIYGLLFCFINAKKGQNEAKRRQSSVTKSLPFYKNQNR